MIPKFPDFIPLSLTHRELVENYTHKLDPFSDFNFFSLWAWDTQNKRAISELNGNLVVLMTDYDSGEPLLSFLGTNEQNETIRSLINFAESTSVSKTLKYLPEISLSSLDHKNFIMEEDRGNFDYIFSVKELAKLTGKKYAKKRQLCNLFKRNNPNAVFKRVDVAEISNKQEFMSVVDRWKKVKESEQKEHDLKHELVALNRLFDIKESGLLIVSHISINGEVIAFSIDETLPCKFALAHFSKFDTSYRGINEFLNQRIADQLLEDGVEFWNWEQDLDLERLKYSKLSYQPTGFLKKYRVSLR